MQTDLEVIDIDALVAPVAVANIFGRPHKILPIDGASTDLLEQLTAQQVATGGTANPGLAVRFARTIVQQVVPSLSEADVHRLAPEQLSAIMSVSARRLDEVRAVIGKLEGNVEVPAVAEVTTPATTEPGAPEPEPTTRPNVPNVPLQKSSSRSRRP